MGKAIPESDHKLHPRKIQQMLGWVREGSINRAPSYDSLVDQAVGLYWEKRSRPTNKAVA